MMKTTEKVLLSCICAYLCVAPVLAIDATSSATSTIDKNAKQLIEKLATKVEETRKKDQKAYVGLISKMEDSSMVVSSINGADEKKYSIKIDDTLTSVFKIVGTTKKELKKANLKVGDYVIVTGQMLNDTLEASEIYVDEQFLVRTAKVTEISKSDYYLKVITYDKDEYTLDIQNSTRQFMLNAKTKEIESSGFSKIKEGDSVHFVVSKTNTSSGKEKIRYDAFRILMIPQVFTGQ
ncbi:MAG: hypothetical protein NTV98_04760 [Candidatus Roizmanbacteria bacterium]|nr:hypothetical protein [Candidatus Roizmanbacteria bacterium]